jgi:hypothetical protein
MSLLLLNVALFVLGIWIGQRAKPLGMMPYSWGAFVGVETAGICLVLIISSVRMFITDRTPAGFQLCAMAIVAAIASIGILRRYKFGVAAFVLTYLALMVMSPFLSATPDQPILIQVRGTPYSLSEAIKRTVSFPSLLSLIFTIVYLACTLVYFKRRWPYLKRLSVPPLSPPKGESGTSCQG